MDNPLQQTDTPAGPTQGAPLVSVLVAVYKPKEEHLRQAVESVLAQTYKDFELVLLDDCPDHPSESIIKSYDDPRIRYAVNKQNCGISETRNRLLDMAKGEFIAILDHDDICYPTRFEKQVAYLLEHPETGVVSSWVRSVPRNQLWKFPVNHEELRSALMFSCAVPHTAAMVRRSLLTEHGIRYEEAFSPSEDFRLWLRLLPYTRFHNIPEVLVDYRQYSGSTSFQQKAKMAKAHWMNVAYAAETFPDLYRVSVAMAKQITRIRILGIPMIRKETKWNNTTYYLFNKLPIIKLQKKHYFHT